MNLTVQTKNKQKKQKKKNPPKPPRNPRKKVTFLCLLAKFINHAKFSVKYIITLYNSYCFLVSTVRRNINCLTHLLDCISIGSILGKNPTSNIYSQMPLKFTIF